MKDMGSRRGHARDLHPCSAPDGLRAGEGMRRINAGAAEKKLPFSVERRYKSAAGRVCGRLRLVLLRLLLHTGEEND